MSHIENMQRSIPVIPRTPPPPYEFIPTAFQVDPTMPTLFLTDLAPEILDGILSYMSLHDLLNLTTTCKRLHGLTLPFLYRNVVINIPEGGLVENWDIQAAFTRFPKSRAQYVRGIRAVHYKNQRGRDNRPAFALGCIYIPVIDGTLSKNTMYDTYQDFDRYFEEFLRNLAPGQPQSFSYSSDKLDELDHFLRIDPIVRRLVTAFNTPDSTLTKLDINLNFEVSTACKTFDLPHLQSLKIQYHEDIKPLHFILSILYSCQNTLRTLSTAQLGGMRDPAERQIVIEAYDDWEACRKCCSGGASATKALSLKKLKKWHSDSVTKYFFGSLEALGIIQDVNLSEFKVTIGHDELLMQSESSSIKADELIEDFLGCRDVICLGDWDGLEEILNEDEVGWLRTYFQSSTGLTAVRMRLLGGDLAGWHYLQGLKSHSNSLRELHVGLPATGLTTENFEWLGQACRNLEIISCPLHELLPACVFDKDIYPKLYYFHNPSYRDGPHILPNDPLKRLIFSKAHSQYESERLSTTLKIVCFGLRTGINYLERKVFFGVAWMINTQKMEESWTNEIIDYDIQLSSDGSLIETPFYAADHNQESFARLLGHEDYYALMGSTSEYISFHPR
ncbi:hypothetical protein TWF730_000157 [Orbilia blumenaviensis]|uniref:F-box domain-containing protein n=1 Tax=Orbilia blumenaviensis TaxID=1796055 RepID=A0AAV9VKP5_9PEZI